MKYTSEEQEYFNACIEELKKINGLSPKPTKPAWDYFNDYIPAVALYAQLKLNYRNGVKVDVGVSVSGQLLIVKEMEKEFDKYNYEYSRKQALMTARIFGLLLPKKSSSKI